MPKSNISKNRNGFSVREDRAVSELLKFLNGQWGCKDPGARGRVLELMGALREAFYSSDDESGPMSWLKCSENTNILLRRYVAIPELRLDEEGHGFISYNVTIPIGKTADPTELRIVGRLLYLANQDLLSLIASCSHCSRAFLRVRSDQKNCSIACSKKAYESRPDFRHRRNEWARKHYKEHLSLATKKMDNDRNKSLSSNRVSAQKARSAKKTMYGSQ